MKIGMLGGTFNPIHTAHMQMAMCARDVLALDETLLMVAADPPHKSVAGHVSADERLKMTQLACRDCAGVHASDLELRRTGKSYTVDTLHELSARYPGAELYLIVGSDMLLDLPDWYRPDEILRIASVAYVPRIGQESGDAAAEAHLSERFGARIVRLPAAAEALSSTEVRRRLYAGLPADGLVPDETLLYCYETGLYFPECIQQKLSVCRAALPEKRFRHSAGTAIAAARLAQRYGADFEKARLAALLHDCAKALDAQTLCILSGDDQEVRSVWHAPAGAVLAKTLYGVQDDGVLRAIRRHCTGDAGMSVLDQVIYLADLIEPCRDFPGVDEIRRMTQEKSADEMMLYALTQSASAVRKRERGAALHPATQRAITYFTEKTKEERA